MAANALTSPDRLSRSALVAVELIDPVTLALVRHGLVVIAEGLLKTPIVNWSGRFVWQAEGDNWPTKFRIYPGREPYMARQSG